MSPFELRKLKRGLEDISPLFVKGSLDPKRGPVVMDENKKCGLQCLSVLSSGSGSPVLWMSRLLVSQLIAQGYPCMLISFSSDCAVKSAFGRSFGVNNVFLPERFFPEDRLDLIWESKPEDPLMTSCDDALLFLALESSQCSYSERMITLLDKGIVWIQPTLESLTEAYRVLKSTYTFNRHLEYFLLMDMEPIDPRGPLLFERFSEMVSRRLGISLILLGSLPFTQIFRAPDQGSIALEGLIQRSSDCDCHWIEKKKLANILGAPSGERATKIAT